MRTDLCQLDLKTRTLDFVTGGTDARTQTWISLYSGTQAKILGCQKSAFKTETKEHANKDLYLPTCWNKQTQGQIHAGWNVTMDTQTRLHGNRVPHT